MSNKEIHRARPLTDCEIFGPDRKFLAQLRDVVRKAEARSCSSTLRVLQSSRNRDRYDAIVRRAQKPKRKEKVPLQHCRECERVFNSARQFEVHLGSLRHKVQLKKIEQEAKQKVIDEEKAFTSLLFGESEASKPPKSPPTPTCNFTDSESEWKHPKSPPTPGCDLTDSGQKRVKTPLVESDSEKWDISDGEIEEAIEKLAK